MKRKVFVEARILGTQVFQLWVFIATLWLTAKVTSRLFCSTSMELVQDALDQHIETVHTLKCRRLISAPSRINSWERRKSNSGLLGEKRKCYLGSMLPPITTKLTRADWVAVESVVALVALPGAVVALALALAALSVTGVVLRSSRVAFASWIKWWASC